MEIRNFILKTNRLVLKPLDDDHKEEMKLILDDQKIKKTYMLPDFNNEEEKEKFFMRLKNISNDPSRFVYGIYLDNVVIGFLNEVHKEEDVMEVGYFISSNYWGQGYATEALTRSIQELFRIGINHVKAGHFEGNIASARVMQKSGMIIREEREEIEYRGKKHLCIYYQIDKDNTK